MTKSIFSLAAVLAFSVPVQPSAQLNTFVVSVTVELSTYDDFKSLTDWIKAAPTGAEVPDQLLQPGTAAMAEIAAAAERRLEDGRWLTLDNASTTELFDQDVVHAVPRVLGMPSTTTAIPPVVIQKGQGFATILGRKDIVVPSGM